MKNIIEINFKPFININLFKSFFDNLELDNNDKAFYGLKPFRSRQILYTEYVNGSLNILNKDGFKQNVDDVRSKERKFSILKPSDKQLLILKKILQTIIKKAKKNKFNVTNDLEVTFHFVKIYATESGSTNSPEGIHRDGYDLLVPCIVTERVNIEGGSSRFYINNKTIFDKIMTPGKGLILEENKNKEIFHDVSSIKLKDKNKEGYRCIIGIDINYKI